MKLTKLHHKKIAILGFGKEGQSTLSFLKKQGIEDITIIDNHSPEKLLGKKYQEIIKKTPYISGDIYLDTLGDFDIIIKSPGISTFSEKILPYRDKISSQTQIFFENYVGNVIGITGTKGKSTISTLLTHFLKEARYNVKLVGNIGSPVLEEIDISEKKKYDFVIYELSSFMLQDFSPKLTYGLINNISPCHLDWHYNSLNIYKEAKLNILRNAGIKIIDAKLKTDGEVLHITGEKKYFGTEGNFFYENNSIYFYSEIFFQKNNILLPGTHNLHNICGVLTILYDIFEGDIKKLKQLSEKVLPSFRGLPHRQENIGIYENITFIDDSIATTPESTQAAIKSFDGDLQTILLGGQDSGFIFSGLRSSILKSSIDTIVAFPDTSEKIFPEIVYRPYDVIFEMMIEGKSIVFLKTRSMKIAVEFCYRNTLPGRIVLLSSGAPSFSLWKNYLEKAEKFIKEVRSF